MPRSSSICYSTYSTVSTLLRTFYDTVVEWQRGMGKLNKLVRRTRSVLDYPLKSIEQVGEERMLSKLTSIVDNTSHPLHEH